VVPLREHRHRFEANRRTHGIRAEGRVCGSGWKDSRIDQLFAGPQTRERIEAVGEGLAEYQDVGDDTEMLDRPELPGPEEPHLDFIDYEKDAEAIEYLLQLDE